MVEALLRWDRPFSTERVILKLEQNGLIHDVTLFVIATICSNIKILRSKVGCSPRVAINVSPVLFSNPWFIKEARRVIDHYKIDPTMIEFEITESRIAHDIEAVSRVAKSLRAEGYGIALDDFGAGFSGLRYLDMIPASALKIDRHFIEGLGERKTCDAIVANVAKLALETGLIAVAEGVETEAQMKMVVDMGYGEIQGFLLAKPMPFSSLVVFLKQIKFRRGHPSDVAQPRNHSTINCL